MQISKWNKPIWKGYIGRITAIRHSEKAQLGRQWKEINDCQGFKDREEGWICGEWDFYDGETSVWHCDGGYMSSHLSKSVKCTTQILGPNINYWL